MISVCYTSARPALVPGRVQEWLERAADPEAIEFVVTIDVGHADQKEAFARLPRTRAFVNHGRPCCVDGWNLAARKARGPGFSGELILLSVTASTLSTGCSSPCCVTWSI